MSDSLTDAQVLLLELAIDEQYYTDKNAVIQNIETLNNELKQEVAKEGFNIDNQSNKSIIGRMKMSYQIMRKTLGNPRKAQQIGTKIYETLYNIIDYEEDLKEAKKDDVK